MATMCLLLIFAVDVINKFVYNNDIILVVTKNCCIRAVHCLNAIT